MSDPELFGKDLFGGTLKQTTGTGPVADKFLFPPFSVLDTKQGEWIERRRAWLKIGIDSKEGRDSDLAFDVSVWSAKVGKKAMHDTSIFDPVICELVYRWFCPPGGQVVDPFCGGSVRGAVAGVMGLNYWGCDLRKEQVIENQVQMETINPKVLPRYVLGDAIDCVPTAPLADMLFSCPPYGDLERYSEDPKDLSTMPHAKFLACYHSIISHAVMRLKPNRFACWVVGDFRDEKGFYRNFVADTIRAFEVNGCKLYNDAIILNSIGTAGMRVTKQFSTGRKFAKIHQNLLIFCKGDWKAASEVCRAETT